VPKGHRNFLDEEDLSNWTSHTHTRARHNLNLDWSWAGLGLIIFFVKKIIVFYEADPQETWFAKQP
jgi:hypothetical protein